MQYIVNEVHPKDLCAFGEARVFNTISEVVRYLQKINEKKRLLIGDWEANSEILEEHLKERHATVFVFPESEQRKKWIIAAF
jgi:hypothetical protein